MLDLGGNSGFFTVLAAKFGCRVIVIDPMPKCCEQIAQVTSHPCCGCGSSNPPVPQLISECSVPGMQNVVVNHHESKVQIVSAGYSPDMSPLAVTS